MAEVDTDESWKKMIFDHLQCIICNDIFEIPFVTNCGHTFCKKCIEEWRKESEKCPICRSDIVSFSRNQVLVGQLFEKKALQKMLTIRLELIKEPT